MAKLNRYLLFVILSAVCFTFPSAEASSTRSKGTNPNPSLGAVLTDSTKIKVGQTQVYIGKQPSGQSIEVILTRTKNGLVALDGTCSTQGEKVVQKKTHLICPKDGSVYEAATGAVVLGPHGSPRNLIPPLVRFTITEKSGKIYIK